MNLLKLSWKNLTHRPLNTLLSLLLFALGVGLITFLFLLNTQVQEKFDKNLAEIDLVLGAKGSPLQMILSSMYHIDAPTGNITIDEAKAFLREGHPLIKQAIPLSLGDNYKGYRIVGTTHDLPALYEAEVAEGRLWSKVFEVTIGAAVAEEHGLKLGDKFKSSHGFVVDDNLVHGDAESFVVSGIFAPSGSVVDQLILTNTQSIWDVHGSHDHDHDEAGHDHDHDHDEAAHDHDEAGHDHDHDHGEAGHDHDHAHESGQTNSAEQIAFLLDHPEEEITSMLLKFKARNYQTLNFARNINENTDLMASVPAIEINRVYSRLGVGMDALQVLAYVIVFVSGLSIFISLYSSLKQRRYELALIRVMGGSRATLFLLIILEGILLAVIGYIIGEVLSHLAMETLAGYMKESYRYTFSGMQFLREELYVLVGALAIGLLAAILPAIGAARTDISTTLARG
jgi:putative ABC transport system permease protein